LSHIALSQCRVIDTCKEEEMKTQYCQLRQHRIVEVRRNEIKSRLARYAVYKTIVRNKKRIKAGPPYNQPGWKYNSRRPSVS
jgi:hypothetical protein